MTEPHTPYHEAGQSASDVERAVEMLRQMDGDFDDLSETGSHATFSDLAISLRDCWTLLCSEWKLEGSPASGWLHIVVKLRKQGKLNDREYVLGLVDGWLQSAESLLVASDQNFLSTHPEIHSSIWKNLKSSHGKLLTSMSSRLKNNG